MANKTISQQGTYFKYDVVVIGSGVAALCYALQVIKLRPQTQIALITKEHLSDSNSSYAQGGIAAIKDLDDIDKHITDTILAGDGLCDPEAVTKILELGPNSIAYLQNNGVAFDCDENNKLAVGKEGGHSQERIYHIGDQTGAGIITALIKQIKLLPNVTIFENHVALNLITETEQHRPGSNHHVIGAYIYDVKQDVVHTFAANVTVLATGGAGKVYRYTSNPSIATGDGLAMAYRAGARVGGLEFYQFHPTLLYHHKINNFLISEALRGEGAYLRIPNTGERFMQRYAPKEMELATRDIVARAIFSEMERGGYDYLHLDITHRDKEFLQHRFPMIYQTLAKLGIDIAKDLIPIVPASHYMCGGILSDIDGRTDLTRLFAVGEVAFTGLHGANRLASNSLLEAVVMGRNAASASVAYIEMNLNLQHAIKRWDSTSVVDSRRASQIKVHWQGLRGEMSAYAGIIRTEAGLRDQLKLILTRRAMIEEYYWNYAITRDLIELRNIILVAELIVRSALSRRESRGGHYREDYPNKAKAAKESIIKISDFDRNEIV